METVSEGFRRAFEFVSVVQGLSKSLAIVRVARLFVTRPSNTVLPSAITVTGFEKSNASGDNSSVNASTPTVVEPAATPVAMPFSVEVFDTVAMAVFPLDQVTSSLNKTGGVATLSAAPPVGLSETAFMQSPP